MHQRTVGRIGSLARLIREAAITAICGGTERITEQSREANRPDHLAAQRRQRPAPVRAA
ncbi:hypothetical protein [Streptomyces actinomycinicus]|uniref:hypothetical protein n=1 Tax=Streptomyces actinomycinicus TaxID=1695166 RepID=UPI0027DA92E3|nr:hypothetical protein [Streptomyces actinomycinicus]